MSFCFSLISKPWTLFKFQNPSPFTPIITVIGVILFQEIFFCRLKGKRFDSSAASDNVQPIWINCLKKYSVFRSHSKNLCSHSDFFSISKIYMINIFYNYDFPLPIIATMFYFILFCMDQIGSELWVTYHSFLSPDESACRQNKINSIS